MPLTSSLPVSASNGRRVGVRGVDVLEGANARMGVAVLVNGSVTVANTSITANTRVFLTTQVVGGTPAFPRLSTVTPGVSFVIISAAADTSTVAWLLVEPA